MKELGSILKKVTINWDSNQGNLFGMPCSRKTYTAMKYAEQNQRIKELKEHLYHNPDTGLIESKTLGVLCRLEKATQNGYQIYTIGGVQRISTFWLKLIYGIPEHWDVHHRISKKHERTEEIAFMPHGEHLRMHKRHDYLRQYLLGMPKRRGFYPEHEIARFQLIQSVENRKK